MKNNLCELPIKIQDSVLRRWNAQRGQKNGRGGRYKRFPPAKTLSNWIVDRLIAEILAEENYD